MVCQATPGLEAPLRADATGMEDVQVGLCVSPQILLSCHTLPAGETFEPSIHIPSHHGVQAGIEV